VSLVDSSRLLEHLGAPAGGVLASHRAKPDRGLATKVGPGIDPGLCSTVPPIHPPGLGTDVAEKFNNRVCTQIRRGAGRHIEQRIDLHEIKAPRRAFTPASFDLSRCPQDHWSSYHNLAGICLQACLQTFEPSALRRRRLSSCQWLDRRDVLSLA
jgi:hypothetical protein